MPRPPLTILEPVAIAPVAPVVSQTRVFASQDTITTLGNSTGPTFWAKTRGGGVHSIKFGKLGRGNWLPCVEATGPIYGNQLPATKVVDVPRVPHLLQAACGCRCRV